MQLQWQRLTNPQLHHVIAALRNGDRRGQIMSPLPLLSDSAGNIADVICCSGWITANRADKVQSRAALVLRAGAGFGRPSSNGRVKDSWLKVHLELDHMETPLLCSVSTKLGALGDFRTEDLNPSRKEPLVFTAGCRLLLVSIIFRRMLEIGLGRKLLIILIEFDRTSSWVLTSTFCRRRMEPSCFSLVAPLLCITPAPFVVSSEFRLLPVLCILSGGEKGLSNVSSSELPFLYKDISVLQFMSSLL